MAAWNFMDYDSKDNLLRTIREEAATMLTLASEPGVWEQPTGAGHWEVRDIIGHLVDTTEHSGHRLEPTAPVDPPVPPVDEHVGDRRIGQVRRQRPRTDQVAVHLAGEAEHRTVTEDGSGGLAAHRRDDR